MDPGHNTARMFAVNVRKLCDEKGGVYVRFPASVSQFPVSGFIRDAAGKRKCWREIVYGLWAFMLVCHTKQTSCTSWKKRYLMLISGAYWSLKFNSTHKISILRFECGSLSRVTRRKCFFLWFHHNLGIKGLEWCVCNGKYILTFVYRWIGPKLKTTRWKSHNANFMLVVLPLVPNNGLLWLIS